jgi:hypothetical protein
MLGSYDPDTIIYVGQTKNLAERVLQHTSKSSLYKYNLRKRVETDPELWNSSKPPKDVGDMMISYIREDDWRERCFNEYYLIGKYKPRLNVLKRSEICF